MNSRNRAAFFSLSTTVMAAMCLGATLVFAAVSNEEPQNPKSIAIDSNRDGKPDRWERFENGMPSRVELDRNGDGKVDQIMYYENGKIKKIEKDSKFIGKMDQWIDY